MKDIFIVIAIVVCVVVVLAGGMILLSSNDPYSPLNSNYCANLGGGMYDCTLPDGLRCIVLDTGAYAGGVDCDW